MSMPSIPIGVVKQFGPRGPEYQILGEAPTQNNRRMIEIVLVRTGEKTEYPLDDMLRDPEAA